MLSCDWNKFCSSYIRTIIENLEDLNFLFRRIPHVSGCDVLSMCHAGFIGKHSTLYTDHHLLPPNRCIHFMMCILILLTDLMLSTVCHSVNVDCHWRFSATTTFPILTNRTTLQKPAISNSRLSIAPFLALPIFMAEGFRLELGGVAMITTPTMQTSVMPAMAEETHFTIASSKVIANLDINHYLPMPGEMMLIHTCVPMEIRSDTEMA